MRLCGLLAGISLALAVGCVSSVSHRKAPEPASGLKRLMSSTDIDGQIVGERATAADATIVVVFASWCQPCRHELAILGEITKAQPRLRVIGLNAYEEWGALSDERRLRSFLGKHAPWLQVVHADDSMLQAFGGVPKIPTLFVYDQRGETVVSFRRNKRSPPTRAELEQAIAQAMK